MGSSSAAEVSVMAEHVERYRQTLGDLAREHLQARNEDVAAAMHEAERALRTAERALRRAVKLTS